MTDDAKPKLITPEGRLIWAWLFQPRKPKPGKDPMYMCDVIFNGDALKTPEYAALQNAARACAVEKFGDKLAALVAAEKFISPFWKNERKIDPATGKLPAGYEPGGFYITVKTKLRPGISAITPLGMQTVIDENDIYSGCWVRVSVDCFAFDNESRGVNFGLGNVLKTRDGDPIGGGSGRTTAEQDFAGIAAPPAAAGASSGGAAAAAGASSGGAAAAASRFG